MSGWHFDRASAPFAIVSCCCTHTALFHCCDLQQCVLCTEDLLQGFLRKNLFAKNHELITARKTQTPSDRIVVARSVFIEDGVHVGGYTKLLLPASAVQTGCFRVYN